MDARFLGAHRTPGHTRIQAAQSFDICTNMPSLIMTEVVWVRFQIQLSGLCEWVGFEICRPLCAKVINRRFPAKHHTVPLFNRMDPRRMSLSTRSGMCCAFG